MKRMWSLKQIKDFIKSTTKDIATLVDAQGHNRFIEGDITIETIEGVSKTYGKWSLSGTHLLFVLALKLDNATEFTYGDNVAIIELPEYINSKIVEIFSSVVSVQVVRTFGSGTDTSITFGLMKLADNKLHIQTLQNYTAAREEYMRVNFDLLIDGD